MFQWFDCIDEVRKKEFIDCINHNLNIGFDEVIIFNDKVQPAFFGDGIKNISSNTRLTYRDYIDLVNDVSNYGSLIVLTNTDIKIDTNIFNLAEVMKPVDFICMSRYEENGVIATSPAFTQDTWAILSQPVHNSIIHQSSIPLGIPGCENRFSEILFTVGFRVYNPSLDIKNIHIHRVPSVHKNENRVFGTILTIPPCYVEDIKNGFVKEYPRPFYLTAFHDGPINIG